MDRKLFDSIRKAVRVADGSGIYEAATGCTVASVNIAKDWLQALKDIVANKVDALQVTADFEKKINADVAKGDYSNIYSQIRQQMPDIMDLGLVAANIESIEKWLRQGTTHSMSEDKQDSKLVAKVMAESMGDGMSHVTAVQKPSKVNASADVPDITKTSVKVTEPEALDVTNSNGGTQGDEIVEGYHTDKDGYIFYIYENGDAFYVDEDGVPMEEGFIGNAFEDGADDTASEDYVEPYELFEDADGDVVYFNEEGDLCYATDEDIQEAISEDVNIYYNSDNGQGGVNVQQGEGAPPMEGPESGMEDPNAQGQPPQEPMQVELMSNGQSGEVNGVVIDVAGKRIQIGPDGTVDEQPAGGSPAQAAPQQSQPANEGRKRSMRENLMAFIKEDNQDYKDAKKRKSKTAIGGDFLDGIEPVDPSAVDALNSGGDIDGHKAINEDTVEPYELFEYDGTWRYYDDDGELYEASEEEVQDAKKASTSNPSDVTIPMGLGHAITSVNENMEEEQVSISDHTGFLRAVRGFQESYKTIEDIDQEHGVPPNRN